MPHRPVGARRLGHVMLACGLHTGPAPPLVGNMCMRTCVQAGLADIVGSRPHGRHRGEVGWRTRSRLRDVRVHRSTDCNTNVNTVPRMGRHRSFRKGGSFPSTTCDLGCLVLAWTSTTADGNATAAGGGATGGGRVYGDTMWRVFVRSFACARARP